MPLISPDAEVERIEMDDGDWYELRTQLSWYHRNSVALPNALTFHVAWANVKAGDIQLPKSDLVPVTLDGLVELQLKKLMVYIKAWSHREPITEKTVKRIPPAHARRLLERIEELEEKQDGPAEDSPLAEPSRVSLEALSSKAEPLSA